jgi:hypothetical protein
VDWIDLAQHGVGWREDLVNTVMKPWVAENMRYFLNERLLDFKGL